MPTFIKKIHTTIVEIGKSHSTKIVYLLIGLISLWVVGHITKTIVFSLWNHERNERGMGRMHSMKDSDMTTGTDMKGMMMDMNAALKGKVGDDFDKAFLSEMVVHHQGAVDMAAEVLKVSKRPELLKLAQDIITAQNKEIEMMNTWNTTWFK
jgi:uncharacterized protein (DUF305 family)